MRAVAATAIDVIRDYQMRVRKLDHIIDGAYADYDPRRNEIQLCTLLADNDDLEAERQLIQIGLDLDEAFQDFSIDFSIVHLRSRKAEDLIPPGALTVITPRLARRSADVK